MVQQVMMEEKEVILRFLCQSKAEEFQLFGYHVTCDDLMDYFIKRHQNASLPLHAWIQEILSLRVTTYMDWMMLQALYNASGSKLTV